ncbi:enoyl-CoA hydratase/isomerase family protein [Gordonia sp. TBRC 11910]|uniref:Enoyl-CoA hydratase/isomerase family protein n=1 Tax=Gordonia asplenii TaxID=2725283 RepID=A0A848KTK7_9ACTN|nr:enoyl-CoA hydratase-related protein [Gordonia asplenii]NMO01327.1 enoyl-CoA hydratase/isomerase family protein [Gordonia asplenii]
MTSPTPLVTQDGRVLTIAISTAEKGTSLNRQGVTEGALALQQVARGQRDVAAVVLVGNGANFCAGGDVLSFAGADDRSAFLRDLADNFHAFVNALHESRLPVVAAVKGWAAGAGMSVVTHATIAVGGTSTKMRPAYSGIGLSPDGGMTWMLPRIVGAARARHIILTNKILDADEALSLGLLSEIVDDDAVEARAHEIAAQLAAGPAAAYAATVGLIQAGATRSLPEQLIAEGASISTLAAGAEGREGVDAFVEKRKAVFG